MKDSIRTKLELLGERYEELAALMSDPEIISDQDAFRKYSKEYAEIEPVVQTYEEFVGTEADLEEAKVLANDSDPEMKEMGKEEFKECQGKLETLELDLQKLLLPKDPNDEKNTFLEIRAGTGGDEASIFSGDLFRMYSRYAEKMGWRIEIMSQNEGDHGGYKEIITRIVGQNVYSKLKFESGAHRVQRVPATESQGRVHTSACTVVIMPEADELEEIDINKADLRIDTFRASGSGGQHVNKTESAIRITHIPSGVVVECQDQRSQHKNKAQAMSVLAAKLKASQTDEAAAEQSETRKLLVGTGDRSDRIRTYNYSQGRISDHRINLTLYRLDEIMEGDLGCVIDPLVNEFQADQLAELSK